MKALVLGGGFGGLAAAIRLAGAGWEVRLLEAAGSLGGKAGEVRQAGFRFDTGPSVLTLPGVVRELFAGAGRECPLEFVGLSPLTRYFFPGGRTLDLHLDVERSVAQMTGGEGRAYRRLVSEARRLFEILAPRFVFGPSPSLAKLAAFALGPGLSAHPLVSLRRLIARERPGSDLERVFLRYATYAGADPFRAPALLHNIAGVELASGVFHCRGGVGALVRELANLARELGVEIVLDRRIERLETAAGRLQRAWTSAGPESADAFVSNLDVITTHQLLGRSTPLERREPSLSGFVLLAGVRGETRGLAHHNIFFLADYPAEFAAIRAGRFPAVPTIHVVLSCRSDRGDAPAGNENWYLMANAPALPGDWARDAPACADRLLTGLAGQGFDLRGRTAFQRWITPADLARTGWRGAIYGVAPNSLLGAIRPRPFVKGVRNLVLAGGTVHPGGGIPLAITSGALAADRLAGRARRDRRG